MTVQKLFIKNMYYGNGANRCFPITFEWPKEHPEYIQVYVRNEAGELSQTTDFKINYSSDTEEYHVYYPVGGEVLKAGEKITIARELPLQQILNLVNQGPYFAEDIEVTFDEMVMMIQQLNDKLGRSLKVEIDIDSDDSLDLNVPAIPGKGFKWDAEGKALESADVLSSAEIAEFKTDMSESVSQAQSAAKVATDSIEGYEYARVILDNIDNYRQEAQNSATAAQNSATAASQAKASAVQTLRDATLIKNSGNADTLSTQNAADIIGLKADIDNLERKTLKEKIIEFDFSKDYLAGERMNTGSAAGSFYIPVDIPKGTQYTLLYACDSSFGNVTFYECDEDKNRTSAGVFVNGTPKNVVAGKDVKYFTAYSSATTPTNTTVTVIITMVAEKHENSIEQRLEDISTQIVLDHNSLIQNYKLRKYSDIQCRYDFVDAPLYVVLDQTGTDYRWAIQGYEDEYRTNRVFDTGWLNQVQHYVSSKLDQKLYYRVLLSRKNGEATLPLDFDDVLAHTNITVLYDVNARIDKIVVPKPVTSNVLPLPMTYRSISHRGRYGDGIGMMCGASAVIAARRYGFTCVENDVALTKDGQMVMWHDSTLSKIGDSEHTIQDYTLSELKAMDFGSPWGFDGEQILTFEEWIKLCKTLGLECYIDFKATTDFTPALAEQMVNIIRRYGMLKHVSYLNNHDKIRTYHPDARLLFLTAPTEDRITSYARFKNGGEAIFNPASSDIVDKDIVNLALDNGYGIECWFVEYGTKTKTEIFAEINRVLDLGVNNITLDLYKAEDAVAERFDLL